MFFRCIPYEVTGGIVDCSTLVLQIVWSSNYLVVDTHRAQTSNAVKRFCNQVGTILRILEKGTPWSNRTELYIGLLKKASRKDLHATNSPMCIWDHSIEQRAMIHNVVLRPLFQNKGLPPYADTFGESCDI